MNGEKEEDPVHPLLLVLISPKKNSPQRRIDKYANPKYDGTRGDDEDDDLV